MKYDPNDVDVNTPAAWWASRIMLGGVGLTAAGIVASDLAKGRIGVNPLRKSSALETAERTFSREQQADRIMEALTLGTAQARKQVESLSPVGQKSIADLLSARFSAPDIAERYSKIIAAGQAPTEFWNKLTGNREFAQFIRGHATLISNSPMNSAKQELFKGYLNQEEAQAIRSVNRPAAIELNIANREATITQLMQNVFGKGKEAEIEAGLTYTELSKTMNHLGSNQALLQIENTSHGAVGTAIKIPYSSDYTRSIEIPLARLDGLVYQGPYKITARTMASPAWAESMAKGVAAPFEEMSAHVATMRMLQRINQPNYSKIRSTLSEASRMFIFEGPEMHAYEEMEEAIGLQSWNRGRQVVLPRFTQSGESLKWTGESMMNLINAQARMTGEDIAPKASILAKGIVNRPGAKIAGLFPSGIVSADPSAIMRGRYATTDPFHMAMAGRIPGIQAGRYFKTVNPKIRTVPYLTTPAMERMVEGAGQQLISPRIMTTSAESLDWFWRMMPADLRAFKPGGEQVLFSRQMSRYLKFGEAKTFDLSMVSKEISEKLAPFDVLNKENAVLQSFDVGEYLAKPGGFEQLVTDVAAAAVQHGVDPDKAVSGLRKRLTLKRGTILGAGPELMPEASGRLGGTDILTRLYNEDGTFKATLANYIGLEDEAKIFGETGATKAIVKLAPSNMKLNEVALAARLADDVYRKLNKLGIDPKALANLNATDQSILLERLGGIRTTKSGNWEVNWKHARQNSDVEIQKGLSQGGTSGATLLSGNRPIGEFSFKGLSDEARAAIAPKLGGYKFPTFSTVQQWNLEAMGVTGISGGAIKPIFGKGTRTFIEGLGGEVGRLMATYNVPKAIQSWQANNPSRLLAAETIMREAGFVRHHPAQIAKRISGISLPEFITDFGTMTEAEAFAKNVITRRPAEGIIAAARALGRITPKQYSLLKAGYGIGAETPLARFKMAATEAGQQGIKANRAMLPSGPVSGWGERDLETATSAFRASLEKIAEEEFAYNPMHLELAMGGTAEALGAGARGTLSERALRQLNMIAPNDFMDYLRGRAQFGKMNTLGALAGQSAAFERDVNWKSIGKEVEWSDQLYRDLFGKNQVGLFGMQDPRKRQAFFETYGVKPGENLVVKLKNPLKWEHGGRTGELSRVVIPSYAPTLMGMQPIGGGEVISRPYERALQTVIQRSAGTTFNAAAQSEAVEYLRDVMAEQAAGIMGKSMTTEVRGSYRLQASSMGGETNLAGLLDFLNENARRAQMESMVIVREDTLKNALADAGTWGLEHTSDELAELSRQGTFNRAIRGLKGEGLEEMADYIALFNREPSVYPGRVQLAQVRTAEDLILQHYLQKYKADKGFQSQVRKAIDIKNSDHSNAGRVLYGWARRDAEQRLNGRSIAGIWKFGQVASQIDTDADQLVAMFMARQGATPGAMKAFEAEKQIRQMHMRFTEQVKGYDLTQIPEIYGHLEAFKKELAGRGEQMSEWAYHQYSFSAVAELYKDVIKPEKPTFAMETWYKTWQEANVAGRTADELGLTGAELERMTKSGLARTEQAAVEKWLEKSSIGRLSNALQASHRIMLESMKSGKANFQDFHNIMTTSMLLEEAAALKAKHGTSAKQLEAVETITQALLNPGKGEVQKQSARAVIEAAAPLFTGKTQAQREAFEKGIPLLLEASSQFLETDSAKVLRAVQKKDLFEYMHMLYGYGQMDDVGTILRAAMGGEGRARTTGRMLENLGETTRDIYRSLGKHKGLLLAGVGLAVGTGLLLGGHGELKGSDTIDEGAAAHGRGSTPLPSTPFIKTARITPGLQPSMNFQAKTEGGAWQGVAESIISPLRGNPNPTIITNVSDYRRHLNPNYISDELEK